MPNLRPKPATTKRRPPSGKRQAHEKSTKGTRAGQTEKSSLTMAAQPEWPYAHASESPDELLRKLDAAIAYLQSERTTGKIRPIKESRKQRRETDGLIAFGQALRERLAAADARPKAIPTDMLSARQIAYIDRWRGSRQSSFAAQLAIARAMWASHRDLVEAPSFPEEIRTSFARSEQGEYDSDSCVPYFSDRHDPLSFVLDDDCLKKRFEPDLQIDIFFFGGLDFGEEDVVARRIR